MVNAGTRRQGVALPLVAVALAQFLAMVDLNITATAMPAIVGEFGRLDLFAWVTTGAVLASTVTTPLYGKLSDVLGRKQVFILALALLTAGSVLCALAQSMPQLVLFRIVQGVGAGGLMVSAMAIYAELLSPEQRMRYQIWFATTLNASAAISPFLGGLITDWINWRWTFWLTVPVALISVALIARTRLLPRPETRVRIDYLGAALLGGVCTCLVLVSSWAGVAYAWGSPVVVGLGAAAIVLVIAWLRVERRAEQPIIPLRLFRDPVLVVANVQGFVTGLTMFAAVTFLPLLMVARGESATGAGLALMPLTAGSLIVSLGLSSFMARAGRPQLFAVLGGVLLTGGLVALAVAEGAAMLAGALVFGVGLALIFQVYSVAVMNHAPRRDLGSAIGLQSLSRQLGGTLGLAALSGAFQARLGAELAARVPEDQLTRAVTAAGDPETVSALPEALRTAVTGGYGSALTLVLLAAAVCAGVGLLATLLLKLPTPPKKGSDHDRVHPGRPAAHHEGGRG
ncbi:MFS transporter [Nonomuraea sp. NPDC059007]|uniref:MFS transporter n=1 Tax=Nonomuraea sp. NPDC059007 TaxID=3346692 RepID=UPI003694200C